MLKVENKQPVTAKDIARHLGLSQPTVSRILSGAPCRVAEDTRRRILKTANDMGYRPNALARSLRRRSTNVFGLYAGHHTIDARNAFLAGIIGGLQRAGGEHGYDLLLHGVYREQTPESALTQLVDGRLDGLFIHSYPEDPLLPLLQETTLPMLALTDAITGIPSVVCDDAAGIRLLLDYLTSKGHRRIAYIYPTQMTLVSVETRRQAFLAEMAARGLEGVLLGTEAEDTTVVLDALQAMPNPPTAVCCWNDNTAFGLLGLCQQRGVRVPEDLSVVGFDGLLEPWLTGRNLVTVKANWEQITVTAMELLVRWMQDGSRGGIPPVTVCPVELVAGTTA